MNSEVFIVLTLNENYRSWVTNTHGAWPPLGCLISNFQGSLQMFIPWQWLVRYFYNAVLHNLGDTIAFSPKNAVFSHMFSTYDFLFPTKQRL